MVLMIGISYQISGDLSFMRFVWFSDKKWK